MHIFVIIPKYTFHDILFCTTQINHGWCGGIMSTAGLESVMCYTVDAAYCDHG